jgi:hypothetical protein
MRFTFFAAALLCAAPSFANAAVWTFTPNAARADYGDPGASPRVNMHCDGTGKIEVWVVDPGLRSKGVGTVLVAGLGSQQAKPIHFDTFRSGTPAITFAVDATSPMLTALLTDQDARIHAPDTKVTIDGFGASTAIRPLVSQCMSATQAALTQRAQADELPRFDDYPAKIYHGPTAHVMPDTPVKQEFIEQLRATERMPVNYGGHYTLTSWGNDANSTMVAIVDKIDGSVMWMPDVVGARSTAPNFQPVITKAGSTMIALFGMRRGEGKMGMHIFVPNDGPFSVKGGANLKRIKFVASPASFPKFTQNYKAIGAGAYGDCGADEVCNKD